MSTNATSARAKLSLPVGERDHIIGPEDAPVTLVEYGDYECPYCGAAQLIVKEVQEVMGNNLRFVFRHFPLTQIHPHAEAAAEAAESAGAQDRFWEMHDLLYANQHLLDPAHLVGFAEELSWILGNLSEKCGTMSITSMYVKISPAESGVVSTGRLLSSLTDSVTTDPGSSVHYLKRWKTPVSTPMRSSVRYRFSLS